MLPKILSILICFFLFPVTCYCTDLTFDFSADELLKNEKIESIEAHNDVLSDPWFSSPPTRTELLTFLLDRYFHEYFENYWQTEKGNHAKNFKKSPSAIELFSTHSGVIFSREKGMFLAYVDVEINGSPLQPLKQTCDRLIKEMSRPLLGSGYQFHNTFMGPFLANGYSDPKLNLIIDKLRNSIYLKTNLIANYNDRLYLFTCHKSPEEQTIHYQKDATHLSR